MYAEEDGAGNGQNLTTRLMKDAYRLKKMDKLNFLLLENFSDPYP